MNSQKLLKELWSSLPDDEHGRRGVLLRARHRANLLLKRSLHNVEQLSDRHGVRTDSCQRHQLNQRRGILEVGNGQHCSDAVAELLAFLRKLRTTHTRSNLRLDAPTAGRAGNTQRRLRARLRMEPTLRFIFFREYRHLDYSFAHLQHWYSRGLRVVVDMVMDNRLAASRLLLMART